MDVTSALGVDFQYMASHTPRHYLPETMGAGVALFDHDNDGRLGLFLVKGAPIKDPATKGAILQKTGPNYSFASTTAQNRRVAPAAGLPTMGALHLSARLITQCGTGRQSR